MQVRAPDLGFTECLAYLPSLDHALTHSGSMGYETAAHDQIHGISVDTTSL